MTSLNDQQQRPELWFVPKDSGFGIDNLPFGVFTVSTQDESSVPRIGVRVGDFVVNLHSLADAADRPLFPHDADPNTVRQIQQALTQPSLDKLASLGTPARRLVREALQTLLSSYKSREDESHPLSITGTHMVEITNVVLHVPFRIGDYTDFYAGLHHAANVGRLFRPDAKPLLDNYLSLPVGYHGRSSSIVVSGTPIIRPRGQINLNPPGQPPKVLTEPSRKLDYEVELGCFISSPNRLGQRIPVGSAADHIFGYVLLCDWSARDIQAWEYVPLGPFNGKNFATSISPWVVTPEALEHSMGKSVDHPNPSSIQDYLKEEGNKMVCIRIDSFLTKDDEGEKKELSSVMSNDGLLWTFSQMIAHHTLGGCPLRPGDLLGSGTISGPSNAGDTKPTGESNESSKGGKSSQRKIAGGENRGSLLEITKGGKEPVVWSSGKSSTFLDDGDTFTMVGEADYNGRKISFGEVSGAIMPAN